MDTNPVYGKNYSFSESSEGLDHPFPSEMGLRPFLFRKKKTRMHKKYPFGGEGALDHLKEPTLFP